MKINRHFSHLLAAGLLALVSLPTIVMAQPYGMHMGAWDDGVMMQRGMMGGMGMMGGVGMMGGCPMMPDMMGPGAMMGLGLSTEQQSQMRRIQREMRRKHWENMGRLMEAQEDLQDLLAAQEPDPAAVVKAHERIAELQRPMIEACIRARNEMRAVLTEEQRQRMRSGPWGTGMMDGMGRGMRR